MSANVNVGRQRYPSGFTYDNELNSRVVGGSVVHTVAEVAEPARGEAREGLLDALAVVRDTCLSCDRKPVGSPRQSAFACIS